MNEEPVVDWKMDGLIISRTTTRKRWRFLIERRSPPQLRSLAILRTSLHGLLLTAFISTRRPIKHPHMIWYTAMYRLAIAPKKLRTLHLVTRITPRRFAPLLLLT